MAMEEEAKGMDVTEELLIGADATNAAVAAAALAAVEGMFGIVFVIGSGCCHWW